MTTGKESGLGTGDAQPRAIDPAENDGDQFSLGWNACLSKLRSEAARRIASPAAEHAARQEYGDGGPCPTCGKPGSAEASPGLERYTCQTCGHRWWAADEPRRESPRPEAEMTKGERMIKRVNDLGVADLDLPLTGRPSADPKASPAPLDGLCIGCDGETAIWGADCVNEMVTKAEAGTPLPSTIDAHGITVAAPARATPMPSVEPCHTPAEQQCKWDGCAKRRIDLSGYCADHPPVERAAPSSSSAEDAYPDCLYPDCLDSDGRKAPTEVKHLCWKVCEQAGKGQWFNVLSALGQLVKEASKGLRAELATQKGGSDGR